jgi:DNA primase
MAAVEEVLEIATRLLSKVKRSGSDNIMAVCPFHLKENGQPERTPSFALSLTTGLYFCHACHAAGNLRQLLRSCGVSVHGIERQYGPIFTELEKARPKSGPIAHPTKLVQEPLPEYILGLFDKCPLDLVDEGFLESTLRDFDIGFDDWHMRITFPLRDFAGRLIGISGRTVTDHPKRYKVYDHEYLTWDIPPRTLHKGGILWNADRIYPAVYFGYRQPVVVVEGFKACMWLHQAGIRNVVALAGSYLTNDQRWILEHLGGVIYVMLDNDEAGIKGAQQVASSLMQSRPVKLVQYRNTAKQPTDLDPEEITQAISLAEDYQVTTIKKRIDHGIRKSTYCSS